MSARHAAGVMAAQCLCFRARRTARALTRIYDDALRPLGIQATQLTLLSAIAMWGDAGAPMSPMADILGMDLTTLSRNLRPLTKAGLVLVSRAKTDRRVRVVRLTREGESLIAEALPLWTQAHEAVVTALGVEDAADLRDRFDATVAATAGKAEPIAPFPPRR